MYLQAQRAFGVSPDRHYRLLHSAAEEKQKIVVLTVHVQEAEGLEAKDANGKWMGRWSAVVLSAYVFCVEATAAESEIHMNILHIYGSASWQRRVCCPEKSVPMRSKYIIENINISDT